MRALSLALALATASCGGSSYDCADGWVKVTFTYPPTVRPADQLKIALSIGNGSPYFRTRTPGQSSDSIEIEVPKGTTSFQLMVQAIEIENGMILGYGALQITAGCPSQSHDLTLSATGASDMDDMGSGSSSCGGCGTGTCAGTCNTTNGVCDYSATDNQSCATCEAGRAYTNGTCSGGGCAKMGLSLACANNICGDVGCAAPTQGFGQVVAGIGFSCVSLGPNNNVRCWGSNAYGVLGPDNIGGMSALPVAVPNTNGITSLVAGDDHVCGVRVGGMVCWGRNQSGQLGVLADQQPHPTPVSVPMIATAVMAAASSDHTCALVQIPGMQTETVYCWGMNHAGELGEGSGVIIGVSQVSPFLSGAYRSLALGDAHLCVASQPTPGLSQTLVSCIGDDTFSQLGASALNGIGVVSLPFENAQLAAGGNTTCAFDGTDSPASLYCWGDNSSGQLGVGSSAAQSGTPVSVCNNDFINMVDCDTIGSVAVGRGYACGGFFNGVSCWGSNADDQLGFVGSDTSIPAPTIKNVARTYVATGLGHACAIGSFDTGTSPTVDCWGDNRLGQTGDTNPNHLVDGLLPAPVSWVVE